jgi:large subunit ribosomal protein L24
LGAELTLSRRPERLTARASVQLAGVNAAELLPGDGLVTGKLTLDAAAEGSGMSAVALMGSLAGSGTFKLENGRVVRLDPAAFDTVMRAVDQGLPIDVTRVRDRMDAALASGVLSVALAEGAITINAGQARLSDVTVRAQRADLAVSGSVNLADAALEGRLTLFCMGGAGAPPDSRPEITIALKGRSMRPSAASTSPHSRACFALRGRAAVEELEALEAVRPPRQPMRPRHGHASQSANDPVQTPPAFGATVPAAAPRADASERPAARTQPATPSVQKPKPAAPTVSALRPYRRRSPSRTGAASSRNARHGAIAAAEAGGCTTPHPRARSLSEILFGN